MTEQPNRFIKEEEMMTTPKHCPGFESLKTLKSFVCNCPNCGQEVEIFSDEFDRGHVCGGCNQQIDFTQSEMR